MQYYTVQIILKKVTIFKDYQKLNYNKKDKCNKEKLILNQRTLERKTKDWYTRTMNEAWYFV